MVALSSNFQIHANLTLASSEVSCILWGSF